MHPKGGFCVRALVALQIFCVLGQIVFSYSNSMAISKTLHWIYYGMVPSTATAMLWQTLYLGFTGQKHNSLQQLLSVPSLGYEINAQPQTC
jgi:hypothetical protein